jgi:2-amino-4-hydroxy-6-hydroxymethyldihydropteridine diphosphokinase
VNAGVPPARVFVGLGANLGDPRAALIEALAEIERLPGTSLVATSRFYRSAPVEASGPDFVNAVVELRSSLLPIELLRGLQSIERHHGRERPFRNAPRTLDLDLLLHGDAVLSTPRLTLPHPRLHLRAFVLRPLLDLAPSLHAPGLGALASHLANTAGQAIEALSRPPTMPR